MTDQVTTTTEAPSPVEAPVDRRQHIDNPIEGGSEADRIRESVRELNKKRREPRKWKCD
jgi:hypothetical protein